MYLESWDYIIVGGGSAGCVLASRLSEDPSVSILLIEAGGRAQFPFIQIPNGVYFLKGNPRYHWLVETEADPTRNGRRETLTCGKALGGGSSINGMVYVDALQVDLDRWAHVAGPEWQAQNLAVHATRARKSLKIEPPSDMQPISDIFLESAANAGISIKAPAFPHPVQSAMPCPSSAAGGWRQNTVRGYLATARERKNLKILTGTEVRHLIIEKNRAMGIAVKTGNGEKHIRANREVILSSGAINTPKLLMLSGIGPADALRNAGIDVILDQPEVGQNLQDHPCIWISANVNIKTWTDTLNWRGIAAAGMEWLFRRTGPAATGMCQATIFAGGSSGANCQMSFMPAGYAVHDHGVAFLPTSSITTAVSLCRPGGRGSLQLRSNDPATPPVVNYRLLDSPEDIKTLTEGARLARSIYQQQPLSNFITGEVAPGSDVQSDSEWEDFLRRAAVNMCHPVGTCRIGTDPAAVVDPRLRLNGVENLRIVDASVMPVITSGNTNAPTVMIAEKAASIIKEDYR